MLYKQILRYDFALTYFDFRLNLIKVKLSVALQPWNRSKGSERSKGISRPKLSPQNTHIHTIIN